MKLEVARPARADLEAWCDRHLGAAPVIELFEETHLSSVIGFRLADGREVVIKARPGSPRLDDCFRIHRHLWQAAFPCAEPLVGPAPLAGLVATAERYVAPGETIGANPDAPRLFAAALHRLIQIASAFDSPVRLEPVLPWVGWEHDGRGTWPPADDRDDDLNTAHEQPWLDDLGRRIRARLLADQNPRVIGHGDWWQPNLWWQGQDLYCVHDWDSLVCLSEAAIAGAAASSFSVLEWGATTVEETESFLEAYAEARGLPWSQDESEIAWAAGLWQIAFNARKDLFEGAPENLDHLAAFGAERLRRAGC